MTNLEFYKDEILEDIKKGRRLECAICLIKQNKIDCNSSYCRIDPHYHEIIFKWMFEEHKKPIKLKRWEYDLIRTNDMSHNRAFVSFNTYRSMKKIGHFAGIKDVSMTLEDILNNCEVIDDD